MAPITHITTRVQDSVRTTLRTVGPRFASVSVMLLRISLGIVFFWFGVLKFFPDLSPAQELATRTIQTLTFGLVVPSVSAPVLAAWECIIGLGLITNRFMGATLALLLLQMMGTFTPLVLFPQETWMRFPIAPTMEGQYILKNMVLVSSALVIAAASLGALGPVAKRATSTFKAVNPESLR